MAVPATSVKEHPSHELISGAITCDTELSGLRGLGAGRGSERASRGGTLAPLSGGQQQWHVLWDVVVYSFER